MFLNIETEETQKARKKETYMSALATMEDFEKLIDGTASAQMKQIEKVRAVFKQNVKAADIALAAADRKMRLRQLRSIWMVRSQSVICSTRMLWFWTSSRYWAGHRLKWH